MNIIKEQYQDIFNININLSILSFIQENTLTKTIYISKDTLNYNSSLTNTLIEINDSSTETVNIQL